jgi:gliding motility-associated-like protein
MKRSIPYFLGLFVGLLGFFLSKTSYGQTTTYTKNNFVVEVTVSNPCGGSTSNGFIDFKVVSGDGGSATLGFVNSDVLGEIINVGSTFRYTPSSPQAGLYDFTITENGPAPKDGFNTFGPPANDGVTLVDLADIVIGTNSLTNNTDCLNPNGQVIATVSGGSKLPALAPTPGLFNYTWSSNNGLSGLPLNGTFSGTGTLDLAALLSRTGLPAGTYSLFLDDAYSVCSQSKDFIVTDPSPLVYNVSSLTPSLCLGSTGTIRLSNSESNVVNYEVYLGAAPTGTATGIILNGNNGVLDFTIPTSILSAQGTYHFSIRAVNNLCTPAFMNGTGTINVSAPPSTSVAGSDQNICSTGTATLAANTPTFGTGAWSVSGPSALLTQFSSATDPAATFTPAGGAGAYVLTWTISNAPCTASTSNVTITVNPIPTFTSVVTDVTSCIPGSDGSLTVTASGGSGTYQYSKDNGTTFQASNIFSGLGAGSYNVLVEDGIGCRSAVAILTVGSPSGISATASKIDVTCNAGTDGSIAITATGGNGVYTYSKDNGGTFQASNTFSGLLAGTYQMVVLDGVGCQFTFSVTINEPTPVSFTTTQVDVTCNGLSNGSIAITASGGNGAFTYSNDSGANFQGSNVFASLAAGPYVVQVKDGVGCVSGVSTVTILQPTVVTFTSSFTDATTCSPANDGTITITASGGTGAYQYSKDGGGNFQASNVFNGLIPGSYSLVVKDVNNCQSTPASVSIGTPSGVTITPSSTNVLCNGGSDGSITIVASGGNGAYQYSINNGGSFQAGSVFNGLAPGTYQAVAQDGNSCVSTTATIVITEPSAIAFTPTKGDASGCAVNDGFISANPTGGTGLYVMSIDNGVTFSATPATSLSFTNLFPGVYNVVIKDANNCITPATVVNILAPGSLSFTTTLIDVSCFGGNNGSILMNAVGGSGVYTYSKDNGATFQASNTFTNLAAASYDLVLKDANGCQFSGTVTISQPAVISATVSQVNLTCNGSNDGSISVTAAGGSGTLEYSIDNGANFQSGSSFMGLVAGNYQVVVKDANTCLSSATAVILTQPTSVTFTSSSSNPTSCAATDGSITVTPAGGSGSYFASLDNGATFSGPNTTFTFNSLGSGSYALVVKDNNNCEAAPATINLISAGGLSATFAKQDAVCFGGNTGSITITASGGTGVYSYSIDNGTTFQGSNSFANLTAGTYSAIARDGLGCTFGGSVTIGSPPAITFTSATTDVLCNGGSTGSIILTATGGNNLFTYSSDNGATYQGGNSFTNLLAGNYSVIVKDGNNCTSAVSNIIVVEPATLAFTTSKVDASTCSPGNDGSINVTATGGSGSYQFSKDGGTTFQVSNLFNALAIGSYNILVKDANSCITSVTAVAIAAPASPDATFTGFSGTYCTSSTNVTLTPALVGGTFSGAGISGNTFSPSTAGAGTFTIQYSLTVNGCASLTSQSVTVINNTVDASFTGLNFVYCASAASATLVPATAGGTFSGPGVSGTTFNPATAGSGQHTIQHTVTSGSCTATSTFIVTVLAITDPLCTGSVGTGTCSTVVIVPKPSPATCTNSDGKIVFSIKPFLPLVNNTGVNISITGISVTNLSISRTNFNDSTFNNLPVGTYDYSIQYGDPSCIKTGQVTIDQSGTVGTPVISGIVNPVCAGSSSGSFVINVAGEFGNVLQWSLDATNWNSFIVGNRISGIPAGLSPTFQHVISVRRNVSDPCYGAAVVTIQDQSTPIVGTFTVTDATCVNTDGSVKINSTSGGVAPYTYLMDGVLTPLSPSNTITGLASGSHTLTILDAQNCSVSYAISISFPGPAIPVDFELTSISPVCFGDAGSVALSNITGAASVNYTYEILDGGTVIETNPITALAALGTVTLSNLTNGEFQVRLFQNQAGCLNAVASPYKTFTIDGPDAPLDTVSVAKRVSFPEQASGFMKMVVAESGTEPYEYKLELTEPAFEGQAYFSDWKQMIRNTENGKVEQSVNGLFAGTYTLTLRDGLGCEKSFEIVIASDAELFIPNIFTPNGDDLNEEFYIRNIPTGTKVMVTDRWGKVIFTTSDYKNNWNGGDSPDGVYYYQVILAEKTISGWVEILRGGK